MKRTAIALLIAALSTLSQSLPASAQAARVSAPEPTRPVPPAFFSGKWYEIARLPTKSQRDCEAGVSQFTSGATSSEFGLVQTCRIGAVNGPLKTFDTTGKITPGAGNAKFVLTFFKVVKQEYWVIDRSDSLDWVVMVTPGGNYAWLMSRKPVLPEAVKASAVARLRAAGYPVEKLIWPKQPGG
jgi:apolipoprotein D and lipocalin family protein